MATASDSPQQGQTRREWLDAMTRNAKPVAYTLYVAAAALAVVPVLLLAKYKWEYLTVSVLTIGICLTLAGAGFYHLLRQRPEGPADVDATRMLVLAVGGLVGLFVVVIGLVLTAQWWNDYFAGGFEVWRKNSWRVAVCLAAVFGGLAAMFASLQLARADERYNPALRRLLYGYNAVLVGLLVVAILGLFNVMAYTKLGPFKWFSEPTDWTASRIHSLSPASKGLLENLDKPLKIYALVPLGAPIVREINTLMDNLQAVNPKIEVEHLSPDLNRQELLTLQEKYQVPEQEGILLVYGTEPNEQHEFVKLGDTYEQSSGMQAGAKPRFLFKGEDAVIQKLNFLIEGKSRVTVYFTQGHGEYDINSFDPDLGLSGLKDRLGRSNYDAKELKLGVGGADKVPDDAGVVVIARPRTTFAPEDINKLRAYLSRPADKDKPSGKLVVLFEVIANPDGTMVQTGLESFVAEYQVRVGNDRVFSYETVRTREPLTVILAPTQARNPIPRAFVRQGSAFPFYWRDVRTVQKQAENPNQPGGGRYTVDSILETPPDFGNWTETNIRDPAAAVEQARNLLKPERRKELIEKISRTPLSVAVAVSEGGMPPGMMPPGHPPTPTEQKPKMVVYGDASWISGQGLDDPRFGDQNYDLFRSTLAWLRERPTLGQAAEAKERTFYKVELTPDQQSRLFWLPGTLMLVTILGLGAGIWVVRRR